MQDAKRCYGVRMMNWLEWLHLPNEAQLVKDTRWCRVVDHDPACLNAKDIPRYRHIVHQRTLDLKRYATIRHSMVRSL